MGIYGRKLDEKRPKAFPRAFKKIVQSQRSTKSRRPTFFFPLASREMKTGSCPYLTRNGRTRRHLGEPPGLRDQDLDLCQGRPQSQKNASGSDGVCRRYNGRNVGRHVCAAARSQSHPFGDQNSNHQHHRLSKVVFVVSRRASKTAPQETYVLESRPHFMICFSPCLLC